MKELHRYLLVLKNYISSGVLHFLFFNLRTLILIYLQSLLFCSLQILTVSFSENHTVISLFYPILCTKINIKETLKKKKKNVFTGCICFHWYKAIILTGSLITGDGSSMSQIIRSTPPQVTDVRSTPRLWD